MIGAEAPTARVTVALEDPAELVTAIVKIVEARVTVGVPLITQVEAFMDRPLGRAGEAEQAVIVAPWLFKVVGATDMETPTLPLVPLEPL
jgi:hypothetical protein